MENNKLSISISYLKALLTDLEVQTAANTATIKSLNKNIDTQIKKYNDMNFSSNKQYFHDLEKSLEQLYQELSSWRGKYESLVSQSRLTKDKTSNNQLVQLQTELSLLKTDIVKVNSQISEIRQFNNTETGKINNSYQSHSYKSKLDTTSKGPYSLPTSTSNAASYKSQPIIKVITINSKVGNNSSQINDNNANIEE